MQDQESAVLYRNRDGILEDEEAKRSAAILVERILSYDDLKANRVPILARSAHQSFSHRMKSVLQSNWTMAEIEKLDPANGGSNDRHREARRRGEFPGVSIGALQSKWSN